jgi:hypothetical protein
MATASVEPRTAAANAPSRRALFGFAGLAGVAVVMPAIVVASMPPAPSGVYAKYLAAKARFISLPEVMEWDDPVTFDREEQAFLAADLELSGATPTTMREFAIWYEATCDGSEWSTRALSIVTDIAASGAGA